MLRHQEKLKGVDSRLVEIAVEACATLPFDTVVAEGVRSAKRQAELWAKGRTAPGPKVTWVTHSNHQDGHAVDIYPLEADGSLSASVKKFDQLAAAMFSVAKAKGVQIRWGADWDRDGIPHEHGETDSPHFELHRSEI